MQTATALATTSHAPYSASVIAIEDGFAEMLRAVVRGERPIQKAMAARLLAAQGDSTPNSLPVTAADLAEGICNLKHDHMALSEWASFILVVSDLFRVEDSHSGYWERLMSCIWDLAFGAPLRGATLSFATVVRSAT